MVKAIFDPEVFKTYIEGDGGLKEQVAIKMGLAKEDKNTEDVRKQVSKDIESKVVNLFGKLYRRLDHERANEFFEQIEQQDIMRGILPAKNMLKQRLLQLANGLSDEEGLGLYRDGELAQGTKEIPFKDKEGNTKYKPRVIISPYPNRNDLRYQTLSIILIKRLTPILMPEDTAMMHGLYFYIQSIRIKVLRATGGFFRTHDDR